MDHRRIEWVLFIIFSLISIYLGFEILQTPIQLKTDSESMTTSSLIRDMQQDNIDYPDVSSAPRSGYYLASKNKDYLSVNDAARSATASYSQNNKSLSVKLAKAYSLHGSKQARLKQAQAFVRKQVAYGNKYQYDPDQSGRNQYIFVQKEKYGLINDPGAQLILELRDGDIVGYEQTYMGQIESVRELQTTISAFKAISNLYTFRELPNNSQVLWIKLVYASLTKAQGYTILLPTWQVKIENKATHNVSLKTVNAFSGQMMTIDDED